MKILFFFLILGASLQADEAVDDAQRGEKALQFHQSFTQEDEDITANVRQAIIADTSIPDDAKNVIIITEQGVVTLKGVVNNSSIKKELGEKASEASGVKKVINLLEITPGNY